MPLRGRKPVLRHRGGFCSRDDLLEDKGDEVSLPTGYAAGIYGDSMLHAGCSNSAGLTPILSVRPSRRFLRPRCARTCLRQVLPTFRGRGLATPAEFDSLPYRGGHWSYPSLFIPYCCHDECQIMRGEVSLLQCEDCDTR